jgi:hypothetical protein
LHCRIAMSIPLPMTQRMLLDADELMVVGRDVIGGHAINYLQCLVAHHHLGSSAYSPLSRPRSASV